ncbi:MAG: hypothetical protein KAX30_06145 [Candidatus Atribacteria bacterium]|nr:hypothetical protein [Candidatus Atribacteria bacterium]
MNKKQRLVLAIFVPVVVLFIALIIANSVVVTGLTEIKGKRIVRRTTSDPFDWENTWYVWLLALVFCCIFEYKLFGDKKRKRKN